MKVLTSLLLFGGLGACSAATEGLEQPPSQNPVPTDAGISADGSWLDASPADAGEPRDLGGPDAIADACAPPVDRVVGTGVVGSRRPTLTVAEDGVVLYWTSAAGIESALLAPDLSLVARDQLGHPGAQDLQLLGVPGALFLVWVDNATTASTLHVRRDNGSPLQHVLGTGTHRVVATVDDEGNLMVADTNGVDHQQLWLNPRFDEFNVGRIHLDAFAFDVSDDRPPFALAPGDLPGTFYLAWPSTAGLHYGEIQGGGVFPTTGPLPGPDGSTWMQGARLARAPGNAQLSALRLLASDFGDRRASVHFVDLSPGGRQTTVQRYAGGVPQYSADLVWSPAHGVFLVVWPDFRESFAAEGYYGHRAIYGTMVSADGALLIQDETGGHPDLLLSQEPLRDARFPTLAVDGLGRSYLAYVTDDDALHVTIVDWDCARRVPDLP